VGSAASVAPVPRPAVSTRPEVCCKNSQRERPCITRHLRSGRSPLIVLNPSPPVNYASAFSLTRTERGRMINRRLASNPPKRCIMDRTEVGVGAVVFNPGTPGLFDLRWILALAVALLAGPVSAQEFLHQPSEVVRTLDRGLAFLAKDAVAWKQKHNCVSCHHASLVIWALREARQRGCAVDEPVLAELTKGVAESGDGKTSLPRPAGIPKALNAKAVWFALALAADLKPDAASQQALKRLLKTVESDQTENGSWAAWPETRPPIFGNSDESMTALATLAVLPAAAASDDAAKAVRDK